MADRLDPDAAREILRRAVEIDADEVGAPGIARRSLEEAAAEVGISPEAVRRAVAEHGAGAIPSAAPARNLLGPARARAVATVALSVDAARARVDKFLRSQVLTVTRRTAAEVEWGRRDDLGARVRRRVDFAKTIRLDAVDHVVVSVVAADDDRSLIRIEAGFENTRRGLRAGATGATIGVPLAAAVAGLVAGEPWLIAAGVPAGAAFGAGGVALGRKVLADHVDEAQRVLELFLAEIDD